MSAANGRGINALCGLIPAVGAIAALIDEPAEVLGYVSDLQDGKADQPETKCFLQGVSNLLNQSRDFLESIGGSEHGRGVIRGSQP